MVQLPQIKLTPQTPTTVIFTTSLESERAVSLLADDFSFEACVRKLNLRDQNKVYDSKHNRRRTLLLHLFTKIVLNYALHVAGETDVFEPFGEVPLTHNQYGKPVLQLQNEVPVQFNSSSSNDLAAIVVQFNSPTPIGIDLSHERQDSISPARFMEQFDGIFAPNETRQLEAVADVQNRYVFFNQLWTLKEAFTKFVGCGLNVDLSSFSFEVEAPVYLQKPQLDPGPQWSTAISLDSTNLDEKMKAGIDPRPISCCSAILRHSTPLPVIVSLVTQSTLDVTTEWVDMSDVVSEIVEA